MTTDLERLKVRLLGGIDSLISRIEGLEDRPSTGTFHWYADTLDELIDSMKEIVEHGEPVK